MCLGLMFFCGTLFRLCSIYDLEEDGKRAKFQPCYGSLGTVSRPNWITIARPYNPSPPPPSQPPPPLLPPSPHVPGSFWEGAHTSQNHRCSHSEWSVTDMTYTDAQRRCEIDPLCEGLMYYDYGQETREGGKPPAVGWYQQCHGAVKAHYGWHTVARPRYPRFPPTAPPSPAAPPPFPPPLAPAPHMPGSLWDDAVIVWNRRCSVELWSSTYHSNSTTYILLSSYLHPTFIPGRLHTIRASRRRRCASATQRALG